MSKLAAISFGALAIAGAVAPASAEGFQGFFAGVQIGDTFGDASSAQSTSIGGALSVAQSDYKLSGLQGGVHAGYNHHSDQFVFGGIVDYNFYDASDSDNEISTDALVIVGANPAVVVDNSSDDNSLVVDSILTLRARGGWRAWTNTLVYATAGWAWARGDASVDFTVTKTDTRPTPDDVYIFSTAEKRSIDFSGFTFGLGTAFMIGEKTTMGFEWRHYSFDQEAVIFTAAGNDYDLAFEPDLDTVELTFSYHFAGMLN